MNRTLARLWLPLALVLVTSLQSRAQDLPKSQPKLLTIIREEIKVGRNAEHAKLESGWPAAYEKAKSPDYYLAFSSMTGPSEVWFVIPSASHAAFGESMKRESKDPVLSAETDRLALADAEYVNSVRVVQAVGRPDLSIGAFPDLAKVRFVEVSIFPVRVGQEAKFEEVAKAYGAARKRAAPNSSYRTYEVLAGMPLPTFLVFSSVESYAGFDQMLADDQATAKAATPEEKSALEKFGEATMPAEVNRFRVDPLQSYVPKETRAQDPEFWMPK